MVVTSENDDGPDSIRIPVTTLEGWRRFVHRPPATFVLHPPEHRAALPEADQRTYNDRRIGYHSALVVVQTSSVQEIAKQGRKLMLLNQREVSARRGLIVSGPWASGKTTSIHQLGKTHELSIRRKYPGQDRIPVVYITTPPKGSPKKLASEFAHFLGLPSTPRQNVVDIADRVCDVLTSSRTDLVLVDEIHNLNLATSAGEDMSDHLKYFTDHLPATFVYAGINVEATGLFSGVRGQQISGRYSLTRTGPFPNTDEWVQLVATLEQALRLERHVPGTLVGQARYLHQRTGGSISSLSHLVRSAAIDAILDETESVDRDLLDRVQIDHAAESVTPRPPLRTARAG